MNGRGRSIFAFFRAVLRRLLSRLEGVPRWLAIPAALLALNLFVAQARTLRFPLQGEHGWREATTYSAAYNFTHASFDFFHPRTDLTRGRTGITGMEPPVVPFVMGVAMRVFGDAPGVARTVVWLTGLAGLLASLALVRRVRDTGLAVGFLVAFMLSPMTLFELRQIQPDGAAVMLAAIAAFFLFRFARLEKRRDYLLGLAFFTLAVLAKGPGLILAPAMWWFACAARPISLRKLIARGVPFVIPAVLLGAWDRWAHHLTNAFNLGLNDVSIDVDLAQVKKNFVDQDAFHNLFSFVYPCYVTSWVLFPAFLVGLALAFQPRTRRVSAAFLAWLFFGSLFLVAFSSRLYSHWYYADIVLVPVAYFAGFGVAEVMRLFSRDPLPPRPLVARWGALVVLVSLAAVPFVGGARRALADVVGASGAHPDQSWMSEWHLTALLFVLATALALAQPMSTRHVRLAAIVLLPFAAYLGLGRGQYDALQVLRWRTRANDQREFRERWIDTLRPLVDRYSTRADLFVVDNDNPYWLYLPLRKGWCAEADALKEKGLADYRRAGARFYLTYNDRPPPHGEPLQLLGKTPYFRLYCLDTQGCSPLP